MSSISSLELDGFDKGFALLAGECLGPFGFGLFGGGRFPSFILEVTSIVSICVIGDSVTTLNSLATSDL